ncbi:MAG: hypothetical protein UU14_C0040G0001 [Candidatus Roizmanbacteria bacterium GW2011_GWB1_40_7]|uniref:Uncharacterized protein n=1 Tax=Candidatus Roizmanbacteria bacterium GW2011_GWB1_40_7 TaxID=1618482 RepID=A0A0G0T7Z7_9BACT|nr:MAG: hypothetical protein UU14_C0040G0001 [Candidatus Roizmanbacteria bacterium GW2011_GWB1_40_7]
MSNRFFKLLYVFGLITIVLSFPIYLLSVIHFDQIVVSSYKAKCLSNNKYVVLQGASSYDDAFVFEETFLTDTELDFQKDLNFYCKYYNEIQPHIEIYVDSKTLSEQTQANINFSTFKDSVISAVPTYQRLYELEEVDKETQLYKVYGPIIDWLVWAALAFLLLQIIRMSYTYIVFGEIVWHPFRQGNEN